MTKTILAVDDDKDILGLVRYSLEDAGFNVITAGNGREALEAIAQTLPALVVMDVEMPEMDGLEVVTRLRANASTQNLPVVMLTAHDTRQDVYEGWRAGATLYLSKPFDPKELVQCVHQVLMPWNTETGTPAPPDA